MHLRPGLDDERTSACAEPPKNAVHIGTFCVCNSDYYRFAERIFYSAIRYMSHLHRSLQPEVDGPTSRHI